MPCIKRPVHEPEDWWDAYDSAAKAAGQTRSFWMGVHCNAGLSKKIREGLSKRPAAHRPKKKKTAIE